MLNGLLMHNKVGLCRESNHRFVAVNFVWYVKIEILSSQAIIYHTYTNILAQFKGYTHQLFFDLTKLLIYFMIHARNLNNQIFSANGLGYLSLVTSCHLKFTFDFYQSVFLIRFLIDCFQLPVSKLHKEL